MSTNLTAKLLKSKISKGQTAAYFIANLIGLAIVALALQGNASMRHTRRASGADPLEASRYMVVTPRQSTFSEASSISEATITDLGRQPWAEAVGRFTPAGFDVDIAVDFAGKGMTTSMFLEAVPDEFLDIIPDRWGYDAESDRTVPLILPVDYLMLYNFAYAPGRGLPSLDHRTISAIPLRLTISGKGGTITLPARVAGFSSRINTVAVPEEFMTAANERFSNGAPQVRRVIVKVSDPGSPAIAEYLTVNQLTESQSQAEAAGVYRIINALTAAIAAIGLLISILSAGMLILSIFLLLQKSRSTLTRLLDLGYTRSRLAGCYIRFILKINSAILLCICLMLAGANLLAGDAMMSLGILPAPVWGTCLWLLLAAGVQTAVSSIVVSRYLTRLA